MTREGLPARRAALSAVRAVDEDGAYSNLAVPEAVADLPEVRDRAFASHLAYETLRFGASLDWALGHVLRRSRDEIEPAVLRVLRLGACQLLRLRVPDRAAVDTAATLAREAVPGARADGAAGFVNGVLRALARRLAGDDGNGPDGRWGDLPLPDPGRDPERYLSLVTAHPGWVVADLRERLPDDDVRALLDADNVPPGLTLRAAGDRDALVAELRAAGLDARPGAAPEAVRAPGADPRTLPAVAAGRATVQDEASMHVVAEAAARPGLRVLDLCAGPGGKATHLAALVGPDGTVVAIEQHPHRAELVTRTAARLGVTVDVRVGDALDPPLDREERFDVVLLDAPCTGLGAGRRRPEVRWRRTPDDVTALAELQRRLLEAAAPWVADGGSLIYAVCTWTAAETTGVTNGVDLPGLHPAGERQLLPHRDDTDGFYHHRWTRARQAAE